MPASALSRHEALRYDGVTEFAPACRELAGAAVDEGRRVLVLAAEERLEGVRAALGNLADELALVPTDRHGRNPARITALLDSFQRSAGHGRALALADWSLPGRCAAAVAEIQLAESLLNVAGNDWRLDVVCLYDGSTLSGEALTDMQRVHPLVRGLARNPDYDAGLFPSLFAGELVTASIEVRIDRVGPDQLSDTRELVRTYGGACGLAGDRVQDLVFSVNELVTNSIRHGSGSARIAMWQQESAVVCEVADGGHIGDPLAGRVAPPPAAGSGRGLWLVNQLCDLVQMRSTAGGTVVRLFVERL